MEQIYVSSNPFVLEKNISEGLTGSTRQVESSSFSPFSFDSLTNLIAPFSESVFGTHTGIFLRQHSDRKNRNAAMYGLPFQPKFH